MAVASSQALAEFSAVAQRAFGNALREVRNERGMTQAELAERVGVSRGSIANIERGEQSVSIVLLLRIASALHVEPSQLLGTVPRPDRFVLPVELSQDLRDQVDNLDERQAAWVASIVHPGSA